MKRTYIKIFTELLYILIKSILRFAVAYGGTTGVYKLIFLLQEANGYRYNL